MPKQRDAIERGLHVATKQRLHKQLERVRQNCFGAEEGLRVLVQLATSQMLAAGASRSAIQREFRRVVLEHSRDPGTPVALNGDSRVAALRVMMLEWSQRTDAVAQAQL